MARPLSDAVIAALDNDVKRLALFMHGEFRSADVFFWTGIGNKSWAGHTWVGKGGLIDVSVVPESTEVMAAQVVLTVSGITPATIATVLQEGGHDLTGDLWLAFLDASDAVIADPILLDRGLLDQCQIIEKVDGPVVQLIYQNRLADLERPRLLNYTDADQQRLHPGDLGFEFVASVQEWTGRWGPIGGQAIAAPAPQPQSRGGK